MLPVTVHKEVLFPQVAFGIGQGLAKSLACGAEGMAGKSYIRLTRSTKLSLAPQLKEAFRGDE